MLIRVCYLNSLILIILFTINILKKVNSFIRTYFNFYYNMASTSTHVVLCMHDEVN
jgi:hypothetical protein